MTTASQVSVPTPSGIVQLTIGNNRTILVLGRNGTGKSALVQRLARDLHQFAGKLVYLPGSRTMYFDSDSLSMTASTRTEYATHSRAWDSAPEARTRPINGTTRAQKAIFDLQSAEIQFKVDAADLIARDGSTSKAIALLQSAASPLDRVNRILKQANLAVSAIIENGELKAKRGDSIFSIARMSDGERNALIMIADVISASPNSTILIDEPETHLHPAISVPLVIALLAERPDCAMLISTHELQMALDVPDAMVIIVRGCTWNSNVPVDWDFDVLHDSSAIPEDIRMDILGSRRKILFVEGRSAGSLDKPLYSLLFPNVSVCVRETCVEVRRAVAGLRQVSGMHHVDAFGIVDNDGMGEDHVANLIADGVFALPIYSVESLYYSPEVLAAVGARQAETLGEGKFLSEARSKAVARLRQQGKAEHLAVRLCERRMRDAILANLPSRSELMMSGEEPLVIGAPSNFKATLDRLNAMIARSDLDTVIAQFPIRETGALADLATGLRFRDERDYEKAALVAVSTDHTLRDNLKARLKGLAEKLS